MRRFVLKVMNADGTGITTVYDCNDNTSTPHFQPGVYDPSSSPDEKWIAFEKAVHYAGENGDAGVWQIFKIHTDGGRAYGSEREGGHGDMAEYLPSFSEDGEQVVFSARYGSPDPSEVQVDVFRMDKEGCSLTKLTDMSTLEDFAVWIR